VRGSEAEDYVSRLFRLPAFLVTSSAPVSDEDVADGLKLTGYFLEARVFHAMNRAIPAERERLVKRLAG
jgi:DNA repair protein RecO (recombination protein O)